MEVTTKLIVLGLLFSYVGSAMMLPSEAKEGKGAPLINAAKEAAREMTRTAAEYARESGEGIRQAADAAYQASAEAARKTEQVVDFTKAKTAQAAQAVRGSDKEESSSMPTVESLKAKAGAASHVTGKYAEDTLSSVKGKTAQAAQAVSDTGQQAGQWMQAGRRSQGDYFKMCKDKLGNVLESLGWRLNKNSPNDPQGAGEKLGYTSDSSDGNYDWAKEKLGSIVETLGWQPQSLGKNVDPSKLSTFDIVVGNVKYVWEGKPREGCYVNKAADSVKGAAQGVGEKLGFGGDSGGAYQEWAKDRLGSTLEILGWQRDPLDNVDLRKLSPLDIVVGKVRYVWQGNSSGWPVERSRQFGRMKGKGRLMRGFDAVVRLLHLLTFAIVYGSSVWMTFISGFLLQKSIPRQQFGYVQSRMFPTYLKIEAVGEGLLVILYSIMQPWSTTGKSERWQLLNLMLTIVFTVVNAYVLEPQTTKVMFERLKVEKEEGRGQDTETDEPQVELDDETESKLAIMKERFRMLHGYSTIVNLVSLAGLTLHAWHLARRLAI